MSHPVKWLLRLLAFLAITFVLMLSGIFDPLAESLKYAVTNLMNYIPTEKLEPYPDRMEDNYFTMYIVFNALAAFVSVFIGEKIVWWVRNT
ncbi:hypothetical protein [Lelliottia amnigena]|jgi:hypothetical protein|uniref:hypothetical protein n=1 Tax=Lelliottia amnigena TaxID=61646 RepID=UPI0019564C01|nr:hypothetical protein [Lelliottia amnigena]MBM7354495.1 sorbitol-specific phosphotransferase system component IIC [Lelliottia amnigena]WSO20886.1 hypothetical protein VUJ45_06845 [Lelliottia amnigena]